MLYCTTVIGCFKLGPDIVFKKPVSESNRPYGGLNLSGKNPSLRFPTLVEFEIYANYDASTASHGVVTCFYKEQSKRAYVCVKFKSCMQL